MGLLTISTKFQVIEVFLLVFAGDTSGAASGPTMCLCHLGEARPLWASGLDVTFFEFFVASKATRMGSRDCTGPHFE